MDYIFLDAGSGSGSLCPMVMKAGFTRYVGVEYDDETAAVSVEAIIQGMEANQESKKCLAHISIVVGDILKLALISGGQKVALHSYLSTMTCSFALNVHLIGLIARSSCIASWIFHSRSSIIKGGVLQLLTMMFSSHYTGEEYEGKKDEDLELYKNLKKIMPGLSRHKMPGAEGDGSEVVEGYCKRAKGYCEQIEYVYHLPVTLEVRLKMLNNLDQLHKALRGFVRETVTRQRDGVYVSATASVFNCDSLPTIATRIKRSFSTLQLKKHLKSEARAAEWR